MGDETYHAGTEEQEVKAQIDARIQSAIDEAQARAEAAPEMAEPENAWNLWAIGPYQRIGGGLQPAKVIRAGDQACVATVLWLNPNYRVLENQSVCSLLSTLACSFEVKYCTGDLCTWQPGPSALNAVHTVDMVPNQCWYTDVLCFSPEARWEGCYEMHICANIKGCDPKVPTPFAGFVTWVLDLDADMFYPSGGPPGRRAHWQFEIPIRFMIAP